MILSILRENIVGLANVTLASVLQVAAMESLPMPPVQPVPVNDSDKYAQIAKLMAKLAEKERQSKDAEQARMKRKEIHHRFCRGA